jgi:hypothetical protein
MKITTKNDVLKITSLSLGMLLLLGAVPMYSAEARMQELSDTNIPIEIPLTMGYADGNEVFYISTEASAKEVADHLTELSGFRVAFTPSLQNAPEESLANIYAFTNGVKGSGAFGFQPQVADSQPSDPDYSPLWLVHAVTWNDGVTPRELKSEESIMNAKNNGQITIENTGVIVNCPFIQWKEGNLTIRANKNITDDTPYGGGQVLEIDIKNLVVTFVAHRGMAPNGDTIYYIATDASSPDVANDLGVIHVPKTSKTLATSASSDLYVFTNGLEGNGPLGFQASIGSTTVGDQFYSPLWRIQTATWENPDQANFVKTIEELQNLAKDTMLSTALAGFVVNCPFVEVTTMMEDTMMEDTMMEDTMMEDTMIDENFRPLMMKGLKMMGGHMYSPYMQLSNGIHPSDVICKTGLELLMRVSTEAPVCVKPSSVERLLSLGFADYF